MEELWLYKHVDPAKREELLHDAREGRLSSYADRFGETFGAFMYLVDLHLRRQYGVTHADLADFDWRTEHDSGSSPMDAAHEALSVEDLLPPGITR